MALQLGDMVQDVTAETTKVDHQLTGAERVDGRHPLSTRVGGMLWLVLLIVFVFAPVAAIGYSQADVERVAAPTEGGIALLKGYDSRTGTLFGSCLRQINKAPERGKGEPLISSYKFVRSMEEVIQEQNLDVSAKLSVGLGIGSASVSVESKYYQNNRANFENGAAYVNFYDYESAVFSNSSANYRLTDDIQGFLRQSIKRGKLSAFTKKCGDSVIIGTHRSRFFKGVGIYSASSIESEEERETNVRIAAKFMAVELGVGINMSERQKQKASKMSITVNYIASGNARLQGATDLQGLADIFSKFQGLPPKQTFDYSHVYIIPYEKLLDVKDINLGIPRAQARKVNRIIDGALLIDRARSAIRGKSQHAKAVRNSLQREYWYLTTMLRREKGCIGPTEGSKLSTICENLYERLKALPNSKNKSGVNAFVKTAISETRDCSLDYPVTKPNGAALCRKCRNGKEPKFLNNREGDCGYVINAKKKPGSTRLHLVDLQTTGTKQVEAGVAAQVELSPNYCDKPGKQCDEDAARRICQKRKFRDVSNFAVWNPPLQNLRDTVGHNRIRTLYANGESCKPKPNAFTPIKCKTFQFIDCVKGKKQ